MSTLRYDIIVMLTSLASHQSDTWNRVQSLMLIH